MSTPLPKRIKICPIIDAIIEVRFEVNLFRDAVFGYIYQKISSEFKNPPVALPILQIPEPLRSSDPNLKSKPHYRLENDQYIVQIGPEVLTISSKIPYVGWEQMKIYAETIFDKVLKEPGLIKKVVRLGLRYINLFDGIIVDKLKVKLTLTERDYTSEKTQIRVEVPNGDFINVLQVMSEAIYTGSNLIEKRGTLLDIDTSKDYSDGTFLQNYMQELEDAHTSEKELFFKLLNEDFLNQLEPEYK